MENCIFCQKISNKKQKFEYFHIIKDDYPVSNGHTLILPNRHIEKIISLNLAEWEELGIVINSSMNELRAKFLPDGFNIAINQGEVAGQTVNHLHIHIIPRYKDDIENPEGGIRNIFKKNNTDQYLQFLKTRKNVK